MKALHEGEEDREVVGVESHEERIESESREVIFRQPQYLESHEERIERPWPSRSSASPALG